MALSPVAPRVRRGEVYAPILRPAQRAGTVRSAVTREEMFALYDVLRDLVSSIDRGERALCECVNGGLEATDCTEREVETLRQATTTLRTALIRTRR